MAASAVRNGPRKVRLTGRCAVCKKRVPLIADGRIGKHGTCAGGWKTPGKDGPS